MANETKNGKIRALSLGVMLACFLESLGGMILSNYGAYIFTDIAGIPYNIASTCMFVVTAIGAVHALFAGAQIQRTRTKLGQYRPWEMIGSPIILLGGLMMFIKTSNIILTIVLVLAGYLLSQLVMNYTGTACIGLQMKIAGNNSDLRNTLTSRYWAGINIAYIVGGMALVPMIEILGGDNEARGFTLTHLVLGILACIGMIIFMRISKPYDLPNVDEEVQEEEKVKFGEMVKGVLRNRPGLLLMIASIFRALAYASLVSLMAYQCEYVIGDMMAMSYFLAGSGVLAVIANLLAPIVSEKLGGRKRTAMISCAVGAVIFTSICLIGKTLWGYVLATCVGYFFISFVDTLEPVMYADAGEYYLNKTGKDTRTYMISMSGLAAKISFTLSTVVLGAVLGLIHYEAGVIMTAENANILNMASGLIPAVCYAMYVVILMFHGVSDKEMTRCIEENAEKYGVPEE